MRITGTPPMSLRGRPTRAASALLIAMGTITTAGSAVVIFAAVIGADQVGLSPAMISLAFSANAVAGIPAARFAGRRRMPGVWVAVMGLAALAVTSWHEPVVFIVAMAVWGAAFWLAIPELFNLLAERSRLPAERVGDAQAIMAGGRIIGPLAGGGPIGTGSTVSPGPFAVVLFGGAARVIEAVATRHRWRPEE